MANYSYEQLLPWMLALTASVRQALVDTAEAVLEGTRQEGEPVAYPINWDSDRQRKAYFATGGFGDGIPYQRTGATAASGSVKAMPYGAQLYKPHPAGAVFGTHNGFQSRIHAGRWRYLWDLVEIEVGKLPKRIRDNMTIKEGELSARS